MSFPWFKKKKTLFPSILNELKELLDDKKKVAYKLTDSEERLVKKIRERTSLANQNNITRTHAYLSYFQTHPEIHWSFLAHMVSRNAGWNMTDLKGTCLPRLLSNKEVGEFFSFLERGNWLIFQDAFPQLLLYEESKKRKMNLAYLLPHFFVSVFMDKVWTHFWKNRNSSILTVALIINEQNHLEETLMKQPNIQNSILGKLEFALQDHMSMNQILFPYDYGKKINLTGKTIHHFEELESRISIGKDLYTILFHKEIQKNVEQWAYKTPHTGSRKDYWPLLFNHVNEEVPGKMYKIRLKECNLVPGSPHFYSPTLLNVWKDVTHTAPSHHDWYKDSSVINEMLLGKKDLVENIEGDYCKTLEKLELACVAKKILPLF